MPSVVLGKLQQEGIADLGSKAKSCAENTPAPVQVFAFKATLLC